MRKKLLIIIFMFTLFFSANKNVFAECSYDTRKQLLEEAKKVDINYEILNKEISEIVIDSNTDEEKTVTKSIDYFNFNIMNISKNLYVKITNNINDDKIFVNFESSNDGVYSFDSDNVSDLVTYTLTVKSYNSECVGIDLATKKIIKPIKNNIYYYGICSEKKVINNKYCQEFISEPFSKNTNDILAELNNIVNKDNPQSDNLSERKKTLVNKYCIYIIISFILIIIIIFTIIKVKKRREQL